MKPVCSAKPAARAISRRRSDRLAAVLKGLILAGGVSARFGRDKAAEVVHDQPQLRYLFDLLSSCVKEVHVSIAPNQLTDPLRSAYPVIVDSEAGRGPAGGLLAAHTADPHSAWLVVACDMPRVNADVLATLVGGRHSSRSATCFIGAEGAPEPLCAIYEPATLAALRAAAEGSDRVPGPRQWLASANAVMLDSPVEGLQGFNTVDELERLK